jgi:biotin operon repressor
MSSREAEIMNNTIKLLDVVVLAEDLPERGLSRGQVGTVIENLDEDAFLVEFSDDDGRTYAMLPLLTAQLIVLHYKPIDPQLVSNA